MYQKPQLQRFGSFRELTLLGMTSASDGISIFGTTGCQTDLGAWGEWSIGCPDGSPTAS